MSERLTLDPVWALVAVIAGISGLLIAGPIAAFTDHADPRLPWWGLALVFALAEAATTRLPLRFGAHEFNLTEVATVLGLFLTAPLGVVAAYFLGVVPVRLWRRAAPVKTAFNIATGALEVTTAMTLTRLVTTGEHFGPSAWGATLMAMLVATTLSAFAVVAAITLSGGGLDLSEIRSTFLPATLVTEANASLALAAVAFLRSDGQEALLCLLPLVVLYAGYRAFVAERRARRRVELLFRTARSVRDAADADDAIDRLLHDLRDGLRAGSAELAMFANDGRYARLDGDDRTMLTPLDRSVIDPLVDAIGASDGGVRVGSRAAVGLRHGGELVGVLSVAGRFDRDDPFSDDDLATMATVGAQVAVELRTAELSRTVEHLETTKKELSYQAGHDHLTGLPNRRVLSERVEEALRRAPADWTVSLLFVDLDDFKRVNDELGHSAADSVLVELGARLRGAVRPVDVPSRIGGDEFAVLLNGNLGPVEVRQLAERVLTAISAPLHVGGLWRSVTASVGFAIGRPGENAGAILANADVAMYTAKARGKNRVEAFSFGLPAEPYSRVELEADLLRAINEGVIAIDLQPVIDLRSGRIETVEALARWRHPVRGEVPPAEFVAVAESAGFVTELGAHVLRLACDEAKSWRDRLGDAAPGVSVNVSTLELAQPEFVGRVWEALQQSGLPPASLTLEIVERVLLPNETDMARQLADLHDLGVRIALDDFGTGYSSLSYLRWLPVDDIKIDRSFVAGVLEIGPDRAVIETVLTLGKSLGIQVIAEGIESRSQLDELRALGCAHGQGYLTGRPVSPAELSEQLGLPTA